MEFVGDETCDKLIYKSSEGCRNKNTIITEGIPENNIN